MTTSELFTLYIVIGAIVCFPLMMRWSMKHFESISIMDIVSCIVVSFLPFARELLMIMMYGDVIIWKSKNVDSV